MKEILLVDKPKGISSFDVIRILRKKLKIKKMGHAGTLDPQATGLLIIGVGKGTKKLKNYFKLPKTYLMDVLLGIKTDTGDLEGKIIEQKKVSEIDLNQLEKVLGSLKGSHDLPVPKFSAIKIKGKKLYELARKGIDFTPPKRKMSIFSLKLLDVKKEKEKVLLKIEMNCGSGTYARSVAEEIGRRLGVPSVLKDLRRTKIGNFDVKDAMKIEQDMVKLKVKTKLKRSENKNNKF